MKTLWLSINETYDGSQLRPRYNYLRHGVLGDSCVGWQGPCDIPDENIMDGEDLRQGSKIAGLDMVHFIFELFDQNLMAGVAFQRIFTCIIKEIAEEVARVRFVRTGDDLFFDQKKFNISIAVPATNSVLIHTAVNVNSDGAPVPIIGLMEAKLQVKEFAEMAMLRASREWLDMKDASFKVRAPSNL